MNQLAMTFPPSVRKSDPLSSYEAEQRITKSGARQTQCEIVLDGLRRYPRHTSAELARRLGLDRYMVARRLADLADEKIGKARKIEPGRTCGVSGKRAVTWEVK